MSRPYGDRGAEQGMDGGRSRWIAADAGGDRAACCGGCWRKEGCAPEAGDRRWGTTGPGWLGGALWVAPGDRVAFARVIAAVVLATFSRVLRLRYGPPARFAPAKPWPRGSNESSMCWVERTCRKRLLLTAARIPVVGDDNNLSGRRPGRRCRDPCAGDAHSGHAERCWDGRAVRPCSWGTARSRRPMSAATTANSRRTCGGCRTGAALLHRRSRGVQEGLRAAWQELLDPAKAR